MTTAEELKAEAIELKSASIELSELQKLLPSNTRVYTSREFLIAGLVIAAGLVLIYKNEIDRGIELIKWSAVAYLGSRTITKGTEIIKNGKKV